jgi:hypothetical protein
MRYRVDFGHVGRGRTVETLETEAKDAGELAHEICKHVRPVLISREISVTLDITSCLGTVYAGYRSVGSFIFEELQEEANS